MTTNPELMPPGDTPGKVTGMLIRLGVLALIVIWCFQILQPFIIPIVWAIIIAVVIRPLYEKLVDLLRGRDKLAAILVTILFQGNIDNGIFHGITT